MNALSEARKIWQGKSDEWLYERLNIELKQKIEEIHRLLNELSKCSESSSDTKDVLCDVDDNSIEPDLQEVLENALYSTGNFMTDQCTDIAEGLIIYIKDHGFKISRQ